MEHHPNIEVYRSTKDLEQNAAKRIVLIINKAIRERGNCFIALSGGETPRPVYHLLGTPPMKDQVDWSCVHLFFSDERIVPSTDIQSNYGMVIGLRLRKNLNLRQRSMNGNCEKLSVTLCDSTWFCLALEGTVTLRRYFPKQR